MSASSNAVIALSIAFSISHGALARASDIPKEVVAECNSTASASGLPDCLRSGAIAFEMLTLARDANFYGEDADQVIDSCRAKNETFDTAWTCFRNAAESAVETRELIGVNSIADGCVVRISDPQVYKRLNTTYQEKRSARFPNKSFFGGGMYYAFEGCPKAVSAKEDKPEDATADQKAIDPKECQAYSEFEKIVTGTDAGSLRAMFEKIQALDEPDPTKAASITGLSLEAADFFFAEGKADGSVKKSARIAALLGAFLRKSHPDLLEDFLKDGLGDQPAESDDPSVQVAQAILTKIIDSAEEYYHAQCH